MLPPRDLGRTDVVYPRTDLCRVVEVIEGLEQLDVRALNRFVISPVAASPLHTTGLSAEVVE